MDYRQISVICPIYQEEKFIGEFLSSILKQDYPKSHLEVLLIDGMSTDATRNIIQEYIQHYPFFRLLDNPQHTVPYALNRGIQEAKGEVIIRLDAHCKYPNNYFSRLVEQLYALNADNVGAVLNTLPAKPTPVCTAIAIGSSSAFGVGSSMCRIGTKEEIKTDTVPFGCYRREVFDRIGYFDEDLIRNQDDEFNARLIKHGGVIWLLPDLIIDYTARDSFAKMRQMYFQYGLFKPLVNKKIGAPTTIRQFFPAIFACCFIIGLVFSWFSKAILFLFALQLVSHLLAGLYIGAKSAVKYKMPQLLPLMPYTFFNMHMSYGLGYLLGIYKVVSHQSIYAKVNR